MITVIVSYYKNTSNLELVLKGLARQDLRDFEVIIAEDDNATETIDFLDECRQRYTFPILHVSQEDKAFRKCKILNSAIKIANADKIVFLDGDCIPHRKFLYWYDKLIVEGKFFVGRRVMLSKKFSDKILKVKKLSMLHLFNFAIYGCTLIERSIYFPLMKEYKNSRSLLGCNMGGHKKDLFKINGFDEDYQLACMGEDSDLEWRLQNADIDIYPIRYKSLTYHLYHTIRYDVDSIQYKMNLEHIYLKKNSGLVRCKNGLVKNEV